MNYHRGVLTLQNLFYHNSHEPGCRRPFGAVPCGTEVNISFWAGIGSDVGQVLLRLWLEKEQREEILELQPVTERLQIQQGMGEGTFYGTTFTVPEYPGLLWYYFIVRTGEREFFYGSNGAGGGIGVLRECVPPSYQITVYCRGAIIPAWFREGVIYQIFVDRFFNGNPSGKVLNPRHNSMLHSRWDNTPYYIRDPEDGRVVRWDFFGGNLAGVQKKLPYLKKLGIRTIYLNPVFDSPSNHKYDTSDYHNIDPMFGDNPSFARLCGEAAQMGINIILDGVFSHTGSDSIYFNKEGNYNSLGAYQSKNSPFYSWYRFNNYPDDYESWWGIDTLPNVNELEPSYREFIITGENSVLRYWHKMGIKGWRLDVADELPGQFLQELHRELKRLDPDAVLIGEVWEDASNKISYLERRDYLLGDELDGVTNYPLRRLMLDFILGHKDGSQTQQELINLFENYPLQHFYATVNMTGSHDVPRLLTELSTDLPHALSEAEQESLKLARLQLFVLWQMTFPGVPCVYYGDETGMEGEADPENRGAYPWGQENETIQKFFHIMIALRNHYDVLNSGAWEPLDVNSNSYAYLRVIEGGRDPFGQEKMDNVAVVLLNRDPHEDAFFDIDLGRYGGDFYVDPLDNYREIHLQGGHLQITVQPMQGRLLLKDRWSANKDAQRASGILLHLTSLPSPGGIGDLGAEAYQFVDFLEQSAQNYWQVLPLNPPGAGNSPYQCFSAFAGDPLLIDLRRLVDDGLLQQTELDGLPRLPAGVVDFDTVKKQKEEMLRLAFSRFEKEISFYDFCNTHAQWLNDYALFMALKKYFNEQPWTSWEQEIASRDEHALAHYGETLSAEIEYYKFQQFIFFRQWLKLKEYANNHGVQMIGDIPLFVAHDSSDVWSRPHLFALDEQGNPLAVAGVPPDYFSETGQLWGNPLYRWDMMQAEDYRWWKDRLGVLASLVDFIRIDHFRGLEAYWEVPAGEKTAEHGKWVQGPGEEMFNSILQEIGELPLIAEDLGLITPEVKELRQRVGIPGMNVLQFMVEGKRGEPDLELPLYERDTVLYTGTHDNDTLLGWCRSVAAGRKETDSNNGGETPVTADNEKGKEIAAPVKECVDEELCRYYIKMAMKSDAFLVIIPVQDILFLDSDARMNIPGTAEGNWRWRLQGDELTEEVARELREFTEQYHRSSLTYAEVRN